MYSNKDIISTMIKIDSEHNLQRLSRIGINSIIRELTNYSCIDEEKKMYCLEYALRVRFEIKREVEWFTPVCKLKEYNKYNNNEFAVKRTIYDVYKPEEIDEEEVLLPDHLESHIQAIQSYMLNKNKILKRINK